MKCKQGLVAEYLAPWFPKALLFASATGTLFQATLPKTHQSNFKGKATFYYKLDSIGKVLLVKLVDIEVYSRKQGTIYDWIIFAAMRIDGINYLGISLDSLVESRICSFLGAVAEIIR